MPFPWKKVTSTKISQLVNDHLHHSQRRRDGSSLVVETGFPASLIDLFFKNREKLKKPSKKKRERTASPFDFDDRVTGGSSTPLAYPSPPPPSPMNYPVIAESPPQRLRSPSPMRSPSLFPSKGTNEIVVFEEAEGGSAVGGDEGEPDVERGIDGNRVLLAVLKIFLVVLLALGTKRLTIGITVSAFVLFFLEYVGQYVCELGKPCSEAKGMLKLKVQMICRLLRLKENRAEEKNRCVVVTEEVQQEDSSNSSSSSAKSLSFVCKCPIQEFQTVEPNGYLVNHVEGIGYQKEILDGNMSERIWRYHEMETKEVAREKVEESPCEVGEVKRKKSRRAKIKSKMKKIVPKRLRSSRKDPERFDNIGIDGFSLRVQKDDGECDEGWESESASRLSSISSGGYKEEDGMSAICALDELSEADEKTNTNEAGEEAVTGLTWRNLALCMIVLVGLIGGRVFALVLALSWCVLLKFGETLPICKKVPSVRSLFNAKCG